MGRASATSRVRKRHAVTSVAVAAALALTASPAQAASPPGQDIVGGTSVSAGWPWAVFIVNQAAGGTCSGALIAPKTVATAAHCVAGASPGSLFVTHDRVVNFATSPFVGATAVEVIPGFDPTNPTNTPDVAKIRLASGPASATPVTVINRALTTEVTGSAKALVAGYGLTGPSAPEDDTLRQAVFTGLGAGGACGNSQWICAGSGPPATCSGDSGGPMIVQLGADTVTSSPSPSNGAWRLAGLTHAGDASCNSLSLFASLLDRNQHDFLQPDTTITSGPSGTTTQRTPTFKFTSHPTGALFQCGLDGAVFKACQSPYRTGTLAFGNHTFRVRALRDGVTDPTPAARSFKVVRP